MKQLMHMMREIVLPNRDRHAVPPMDGPIRPNNAIEDAEVVAAHPTPPGGLCADAAGELFYFAGREIFRLADDAPERVALAEHDICSLAVDVAGGGFLVGQLGHGVVGIGGRCDGRRWREAGGRPLAHVNAITVSSSGAIYVSEGSAVHAPAHMVRDLMDAGKSGRLLRLAPNGDGAEPLKAGIPYPGGVLALNDESLLFSESWTHALKRHTPGEGASVSLIPNLAGYPGHMSRARRGGFWVTFPLIRTLLVEFVLTEDSYRKEMMRTVPDPYWVSPSLSAEENLLTPLQFGRIKVHGATKPWAPSRSYGLVVEYNRDAVPLRSFHSRAGGRMHGLTSAAETPAGLYATSHSSSSVIKVALS